MNPPTSEALNRAIQILLESLTEQNAVPPTMYISTCVDRGDLLTSGTQSTEGRCEPTRNRQPDRAKRTQEHA